MAYIYRVAHRDDFKQGMYRSNVSYSMHGHRHPMPYDDASLSFFYKINHTSNIHIFGFRSKAQLKNWVYKKELRENLEQGGYIVYKIKPLGKRGKDWELGDTQAIFDKTQYGHIEAIKLTEL